MITELIDLIVDDIKEKDGKVISDISSRTIFGNISSTGNNIIKKDDLKENIKFEYVVKH